MKPGMLHIYPCGGDTGHPARAFFRGLHALSKPGPAFTVFLPAPGRRSPLGYRSRSDARPMGDFLVIVGIVVFTAAMLGLIWALERV